MDDLISRHAAIEAITKIDYISGTGVKTPVIAKCNAVAAIESLPSVQPEITHCAECIHWKHSDVRENYCEVFDWTNKAEDFCSFAERRKE